MKVQTRHAALQLLLKMGKNGVLSDSDGSDMDYNREIGHLPPWMLKVHARFMGTDDERNNIDYGLPLPQSTMATREAS